MKQLCVLLFAVLLVLTACAPANDASAINEEMVVANISEIWNNGNLDKIDEMYAANLVRHHPASYEQQMVEGIDAFKEYVKGVRETFAGFKVEVIESVAKGNVFAIRWNASGTHQETQKPVQFSGMSFLHFENGKVVSEYLAWDTQSVVQQIQATEGMATQ